MRHGSLLQEMQKFSAKKGFSQAIQFSSGNQFDLNTPFTI
jgi:hypothetical protein